MVRVTKFANTNLSDALLNETALFWGVTDPSSGLPANVWFFNTTDGKLKQNTGTEGSPVWEVQVGAGFGIGDGSDGDATISSNTDLTTANIKRYDNLTINSGITLEGDTGMIIMVKNNLVLNGTIRANGFAGGAGSTGQTDGDGGASGGSLIVVVGGDLSGTGIIQVNGLDGQDGITYVSTGNGVNGVDGEIENIVESNSKGVAFSGASSFGQGGGAGASIGAGGSGGEGGTSGGTAFSRQHPHFMQPDRYEGGSGAGGHSGSTNSNLGGGGGGAGGSITVILYGLVTAINIEAKGGNGGDGGSVEWAGSGGGGGGKLFLHSRQDPSSIVTSVVGGAAGTNAVRPAGNAGANGIIQTGGA